jgi:transcriptional regulator with XRE-family HTH domain
LDGIHIPGRVLEGDFAGWLRDAMNERGMSPRTVGLQAGVDPRWVSGILYGGRQPTIATALALLRYFGEESVHTTRSKSASRDISLL